ncbi:MAG: RNase P subunit p30 family protein [Nanoarchaeota archaeon]|nr:RNase P subunit p30 family protein [Nanoarchaeota archaeon]
MKDINLFRTKDSIFLKKIKSKSEILKTNNCDGYLIEASESEARKIIESLKGKEKIIAIIGGDSLFNRRAIETLRIDYLISPERGSKNDSLKQRDSGLNYVVAKEAAKKDVSVVIDFSDMSRLQGKEKALRLSRLIQNIKVCRKAKCSIKIASFAGNVKNVIDKKSLSSFGISLGMSSEQSRDAVRFYFTKP